MEIAGILVLVFSFLFLLVIGVPIAYSIGVAGVLTMLTSIDSLPAFTTFAQRMATGLDSFALLAIPFFILAGAIMNRGGIAVRLINFARVLVSRFPGGLAFVNVIANMLFGAISGSAAASASAIGGIMKDEMKKEGYDENFSAAVNISSATTGLSIPPSNVLIVYSLASGGASVAALFMAGYIPGIMTGLAIIIVASVYAYLKGYPTGMRIGFSASVKRFLDAIPSLFLLVIVVGGIIAGYFTATEASAIAVLYALILSFIYKEISFKDLPSILLYSVKSTAVVMLLIATCIGLSWIMAYENIFTPIFLPIVTEQIGLDAIHFGIIMVLNLSVGLCTPPVGSVLFIGCSVAKVRIENVIKPLLPMFAAMIVVLLLVTYFPVFSMWLPGVLGY